MIQKCVIELTKPGISPRELLNMIMLLDTIFQKNYEGDISDVTDFIPDLVLNLELL
jgi:hypothetical protein